MVEKRKLRIQVRYRLDGEVKYDLEHHLFSDYLMEAVVRALNSLSKFGNVEWDSQVSVSQKKGDFE